MWRDCIDRVVILPPDTDDPIILQGTGAVVWDMLAPGPTVEEMAESLAASFDADARTITADVATCLQELRTLGVVEQCPA